MADVKNVRPEQTCTATQNSSKVSQTKWLQCQPHTTEMLGGLGTYDRVRNV